MSKRNYTHVEELFPEIEAMIASGKTQREVAEHFGFRDKYVVKSLVKRERAKQRKREAGITIRPRGRQRKDAEPKDIIAEQAYEIRRLRMENELLRDFLRSTGSESKGKICRDLPIQGKISCACHVPILCSVQERLLQLCKADGPC